MSCCFRTVTDFHLHHVFRLIRPACFVWESGNYTLPSCHMTLLCALQTCGIWKLVMVTWQTFKKEKKKKLHMMKTDLIKLCEFLKTYYPISGCFYFLLSEQTMDRNACSIQQDKCVFSWQRIYYNILKLSFCFHYDVLNISLT